MKLCGPDAMVTTEAGTGVGDWCFRLEIRDNFAGFQIITTSMDGAQSSLEVTAQVSVGGCAVVQGWLICCWETAWGRFCLWYRIKTGPIEPAGSP